MKKVAILVLSALLLSLLLAPAYAAEETMTLRLTADRVSVAPGGTVTVSVEATANPGWNMFGATPGFDKSVMTLEGISYGSIGAGTPGSNAIIDAGMEDTTATGFLFSYTLKVREDAKPGETVLGLIIKEGYIVSITEEDVPAKANTVTVTVLDPASETWGQTLAITDRSGNKVEFTFDDVDYDPATGEVTLSESFKKAHPDGVYTITFQNDAGETVKNEETTPAAPASPAAPDNAAPDDAAPAPAGSSSLPLVLGVSAVIILAVTAAVILTVLKKKPAKRK